MALYLLWGLTGIGIAFILEYLYYFLQEYFVCRKRYGFSISKDVILTYTPYFVLCVLSLLAVMLCGQVLRYVAGSLIIIVAGYISFKKLDKKVDIRGFIKSKTRK